MTDDIVTRLVTNVLDRVHGPFMFRFVLQPTMAMLLAIRDGRADAKADRPAYLWAVLNHPGDRIRLLQEGSLAVARVLVLGVVMDLAYQLVVFRWFYPMELIVTVLLIVFVPYLLVRGPANRMARLRYLGASPTRRTDNVRERPIGRR